MVSILIVRTSAIGDVIQTLPVLQYLQKRFPDAKIDWVVEEGIGSFLRQIECVSLHRVIEIQTRQWGMALFSLKTYQQIRAFYRTLRSVKYDIIFDLQGNAKSALITRCAFGKGKVGFGRQSVREKINLFATTTQIEMPLEINIRLKYLGLVQKYFEDKEAFDLKGYTFCIPPEEKKRLEPLSSRLMIAVGSRWKNKTLSEGGLISFLQKIAESTDVSFLFVFGNETEKALANRLIAHFPNRAIVVGDLSLAAWQTLMCSVDGVVAVDSAALHLVGTTKTPSFSIFGPTQASIFKPLEEHHHTIQGQCPYGRSFIKQCPVLRTCPTGACIQEISIDAVFGAFQKWYTQIT